MTAQRYSIHLWVIPGPFPQTPTAPTVAISVHLQSSSSFPPASFQLLHLRTGNTRQPIKLRDLFSKLTFWDSATLLLLNIAVRLLPSTSTSLFQGPKTWLAPDNECFQPLTPPDFPSLKDFNGFSHLYGLALQIH